MKNVHQVKEMIESNQAIIIDIRQKEDFDEAHIKGAVYGSEEFIKELLESKDKERTIICYCYHGISSQNASKFFKDNGFKNVFSLQGGIEEWKANYAVI